MSSESRKEAVSRESVCPVCEQTVRVSRRQGVVYSHMLADRITVCGGSGRFGGVPEGGDVIMPSLKRIPISEPVQPLDLTRVESSSVKAFNAGAPGSGRRA